VTEEFFEDYRKNFNMLRDELRRQRISKKDSHEFALQFLNRIMFIYFIQKKDGLGKGSLLNGCGMNTRKRWATVRTCSMRDG